MHLSASYLLRGQPFARGDAELRVNAAFILRAVGGCVACDRMRVRLLLLSVAVTIAVWALMPVSSPGQDSKQQQLSELQHRIDRARRKIGRRRGTERVLSTEIAGYTHRIGRLQSKITTLSARQRRIQTDLDANLGELKRLRTLLRRERARVVRLRKRLNEARTVLSDRLVEIYKTQKPDARRQHRSLLRGAPAFRSARQRHARRPDGIPVTRSARLRKKNARDR